MGKNATIYATVHFAGTDSPFSAAQFTLYPDIALVPALAAAVVPGLRSEIESDVGL